MIQKRRMHKPFVRLGDQTKLLQNLPHHSSDLQTNMPQPPPIQSMITQNAPRIRM